MEEFHVSVRGIEPPEYMQSLRRVALRPYLWMCLIVVLVVAGIAFWTSDTRIQSFVVPAVILIAIPVLYEGYHRSSCKHLPLAEAEMDYWLSQRGWRMEANGASAVFTWGNTKLVETKDDLLLYTDRKTSSLLPKRLLTGEQLEQVRAWSRTK